MKYILNLLRRWFGFSKTYYAVVTEHDGGPEGSRGGPMLWEQYLSFAQDYREAKARQLMLGNSFGKTYIVKVKYYSGEYFTNHIVPNAPDEFAPKNPEQQESLETNLRPQG